MTAQRSVRVALSVLAITQLIGWGTLNLPAVLSREMAADLDMTLAAIFAGPCR